MSDKSWIEAAGPAVSWVLVIGGWIYVSRSNDKRECRKEARALLDDVRKLILEIEKQAYGYYRSPVEGSQRVALSIKRDFTRLGSFTETLRSWVRGFDCDDGVMWFRQCVTGGDFESGARVLKDDSDELFLRITPAAEGLLTDLEAAFLKSYPRV